MKHFFTFILTGTAILSASAQNSWGLEGNGTSDSPYLISSAEDFGKLASNISSTNTGAGEYFELTADIDFKGTESSPAQLPAIGKEGITNVANVAWGFEGELDGKGFTISGIYHTNNSNDRAGQFNALFSSVGISGVIKNIIFGEDNYVSTYNYGAPIASMCKGIIENCENHAPIAATNAFAAGICGQLLSGAGTITGCKNYGEIRSMTYAAGIVAGCQSGGTLSQYDYMVSDCENYGDIWTNNFTGGAGIAGSYSGTLKNCTNNGNISGNSEYANSKQYSGGIISCASYLIWLDGCVNNGRVEGYNKSGGIIGNVMKGNDTKVLISNCVNKGVVETYGSNVAGIIGNSMRSQDMVTVENCRNEAEVTTTVENADADELIGNIRGSLLIELGEGNTYATGLESFVLDEGAEQTDEDNAGTVAIGSLTETGDRLANGKYMIGGKLVIISSGEAFTIDGKKSGDK